MACLSCGGEPLCIEDACACSARGPLSGGGPGLTDGCRVGYSWKTNQYGLTVDNLSGYELVLPNGTVATVTESSFPDLFWGLKVRSLSARATASISVDRR